MTDESSAVPAMTAADMRTLRGVLKAAPVGAIISLPASAVLAVLDMAEGRRPVPQEASHEG